MYTESGARGCSVHFSLPGAPSNVHPRWTYPMQRQPYVLHTPRNSLASRQRCIAAAAPEQAERFWSVRDVLQEAEEMGGSTLVFEDDSFEPVWEHEQRVASQPLDFDVLQRKVEVKGALRADDADVLSAYSTEQGFKETTVDKLRAQLDSVFVLDVRMPQEYNAGHVPLATNIPLDALSDAVRKGCLDSVKKKTVAVICASGGRSAQATVRLSKVFGFPDVVNVVGGTSEWISSGFPIERSI